MEAARVAVKLQPRGRRDELLGFADDVLRVRVAAPPVDGKANDATRALLARTLGVKDGAVTLVSGASSRSKRFRVDGVDGEAAATALRAAIAGSDAHPGNPGRGRRR